MLEFSGVRLTPAGAPMRHSAAKSAPDCRSRCVAGLFIVISTPILHFRTRVVKVMNRCVCVQPFCAELAIEGLDETVVAAYPVGEVENDASEKTD